MKKYITLILLLLFVLSLTGCNKQSDNEIKEPDNQQVEDNTNTVSFEAVILEVLDASVLVCPVQGSNELKSADKISVSLGKLEVLFDFIVGQTIRIEYDGLIAESYPAQIFNTYQIELVSEPENTKVFFNGKWFDRSKLSEATLKWLELSEEDRLLSSYYPTDLIEQGGWADLDNRQEGWGIELQTKNVTPSGLTIVCEQIGGENVFELNTGSYFVIQKLEETGYINVEYLPQEYDIAWTAEAWIINKDATTTWDVNWEWLYGKLPAGEYRIGKEIMNFRGPGDFDQEIIYAHFEIQADYGRETAD